MQVSIQVDHAKVLKTFTYKDKTRPHLAGLHVQDGRIYATDSHRFASYDVDDNVPEGYYVFGQKLENKFIELRPQTNSGSELDFKTMVPFEKPTERFHVHPLRSGKQRVTSAIAHLALRGILVDAKFIDDLPMTYLEFSPLGPFRPIAVTDDEGFYGLLMPMTLKDADLTKRLSTARALISVVEAK